MPRQLDTRNEAALELGARLERNARRRAAEASARSVLRGLDARTWHVEQSVFAGPGICVSFVVAGPTGIFTLVATDGPWSLGDIELLARAARSLAESVPSLVSEICAAIVTANSAAAPREWFAADGSSGWVLGDQLLPTWLRSFPADGFDQGDIVRLREASQPRWDRSARGRLGTDLTRPGGVG